MFRPTREPCNANSIDVVVLISDGSGFDGAQLVHNGHIFPTARSARAVYRRRSHGLQRRRRIRPHASPAHGVVQEHVVAAVHAGRLSADLVTADAGVLVHVERRPAAAAHRLTLNPGETATADVQAYAIDTATGNACPRTGTVVVAAPGTDVSHTLNAALPICNATVSSVD